MVKHSFSTVVDRTLLSLRAMRPPHLDLLRGWLDEPHVARWFLTGSTLDGELDQLRRCIAGEEPTRAR